MEYYRRIIGGKEAESGLAGLRHVKNDAVENLEECMCELILVEGYPFFAFTEVDKGVTE